MSGRLSSLGTSALVVVLLAWTCAAQEPKTTGEQLKDKANQAVKAIKKGVAGAEATIEQEYAKAKTAVRGMGIQARVYARLHWDKALHESRIEVHAQRDATVTLTGTVPSAEAKEKAVALAGETVGVTSVIDQLTVPATTPTKASRR